jgi:hypothetical protein
VSAVPWLKIIISADTLTKPEIQLLDASSQRIHEMARVERRVLGWWDDVVPIVLAQAALLWPWPELDVRARMERVDHVLSVLDNAKKLDEPAAGEA